MENNIEKKRGRPAKTPTVSENLPSNSDAMEKLLAKVEALEKKDEENQAKLKMLYDVADKGRVLNYENAQPQKKPFKVKLSKFRDGIIVGWRTVRDELVKHPTTGSTVGENQEYEILILDGQGGTQKASINGYPAFSNARYNERIDCEVVGKKEDFSGNISFEVLLLDGRKINIDSRFVN